MATSPCYPIFIKREGKMNTRKHIMKISYGIIAVLVIVIIGLLVYQQRQIGQMAQNDEQEPLAATVTNSNTLNENNTLTPVAEVGREKFSSEVDELKYQLDAAEEELEMARGQLDDEIARKAETSMPPLPTTPEGEKMMRNGLKNGYDQTYSALFKELNLSPETIDQLKELLADREIARTKSILELYNASTEEERKDLQKQLDDKNDQIDDALEALLGSEEFQAFEHYNDSNQDRQMIQKLSGVLSFDDTLSGDQKKSLLESLYNKRKNTYVQLGFNEESPADLLDLDGDGISDTMEVEFIVYDGYIEGIEEAELSESQKKQLKEFLEKRQAIMKSRLEQMERIENGDIDPEEADAEERVIILN
jgi:hypothetical protein